MPVSFLPNTRGTDACVIHPTSPSYLRARRRDLLGGGLPYEMGDKTYEDLVIFSNYYQTYINQVFGDQTVREEVQKILKKPSQWQITEAISADENSFASGDDSMHHILRKTANPKEIWCSVEVEEYQNTNINKNDTLCHSYTLLKLSGDIDHYEPLPKNSQNHIAIQKEMIKLYGNVIKNRIFSKFINEVLAYTKEYTSTPWIDYTKKNNPNLKEMNAKEMIKKIKQTLDMWQNYGHLYFVGDPQNKYYTIPLRKSIQEKNMDMMIGFIQMNSRLKIINESEDDNVYDKSQKQKIQKLLTSAREILDNKENFQILPNQNDSVLRGGKTKMRRKKTKGRTRTKKRYKTFKN